MSNIRTYSVTLVCVVLIVLTNAQNPTHTLTDYYSNKCRINSNNEAHLSTLHEHVSRFVDYLEYAFAFLPVKKQIFCDSLRRELENRIKQVSEDLKPCLSRGEEYLPNFIHDSFKGFTEFLCHSGGKNIDSFFTAQGRQCRDGLDADNSNELHNCLGRIFKPTGSVLSKQELCADVTVAEKCFTLILNQKCSNFKTYQELNTNFFEYIRKPCSGCVSYLNSLILTLSMFFALMLSR